VHGNISAFFLNLKCPQKNDRGSIEKNNEKTQKKIDAVTKNKESVFFIKLSVI
jgi:hypothetical protein